MKGFTRERDDPLEMMRAFWPDADLEHITYDSAMLASTRDYWRLAEGTHDGTATFTIRTLQRALLPLVNMESAARNPPADAIGVKYTVGPLRLATVFGTVELKIGRYPGQRERARIPVKCEYVFE